MAVSRRRLSVRARIARALDALKVGDHLFATEILEALEDDLDPARVRCRTCGARFRWPGELEAHRARSGCGAHEEAA